MWRGGTGALMAARCRGVGIDEPVFLCDTWEGVVKTGAVDTYYHDGKHDDTSQQIVQDLVDRLGLDHVRLPRRASSPTTPAIRSSPTRRFRLVPHRRRRLPVGARTCSTGCGRGSRPGGVVVFDDYGFPACPGITRFVDEQRDARDRLVLHNLNGHGLVVKR